MQNDIHTQDPSFNGFIKIGSLKKCICRYNWNRDDDQRFE